MEVATRSCSFRCFSIQHLLSKSTYPRTAIPGSTSDACLSLYDSSSHYCTWFSPAFRHVKACAYNLWISAFTNVQLFRVQKPAWLSLTSIFQCPFCPWLPLWRSALPISSPSRALPGASAPPPFPWARHSSASQLPPPNSEPHQQLPRAPRARHQVFKELKLWALRHL